MRRSLEDAGHKYLAIPMEYPISDNEAHSTYEGIQLFIQVKYMQIMHEEVWL